jgi:hypothetical protein
MFIVIYSGYVSVLLRGVMQSKFFFSPCFFEGIMESLDHLLLPVAVV